MTLLGSTLANCTVTLHFICTLQRMAESTTVSDNMTGGFPEYSASGGIGLICAGVLDTLAARVVCAETAEMFLHNMTDAESTGSATNVFYQGSVECTGDEASLAECSVRLRTVSECPGGLVQQLTCTSCKLFSH